MEDIRLIIVLIIAALLLIWLLFRVNSLDKKNIYVYPKTNNKYLIKGIVKMKDSLTCEWVDAVLYISLKNGHYYVREKIQFLDKFITLKEWEKQNGNNK